MAEGYCSVFMLPCKTHRICFFCRDRKELPAHRTIIHVEIYLGFFTIFHGLAPFPFFFLNHENWISTSCGKGIWIE